MASSMPTRNALALLPPAPYQFAYGAIRVAYQIPLWIVFRNLSPVLKDNPPTLLEIAVPCPHLHGNRKVPRAALYKATQSLVANIYKLICVICTKEEIDINSPDGINPHVILVEYPQNGKLDDMGVVPPARHMQGPVIDLNALAQSGRTWHKIYSVGNDAGDLLLQNFKACGGPNATMRTKGGGVEIAVDPDFGIEDDLFTRKKHLDVAVGGTFDHLHVGHKLLLTMTAFLLDEIPEGGQGNRSLTVGITGQELLKNKQFAEYLESWEQRKDAVDRFLRTIICFDPQTKAEITSEEKSEPGPNGHSVNIQVLPDLTVKCVEIWDPFGPTITEEAITALVVSGETRSGGSAVNDKRKERGWAELEVFEVDVLDAEDESSDPGITDAKEDTEPSISTKISSTEIRRRESERDKADKMEVD